MPANAFPHFSGGRTILAPCKKCYETRTLEPGYLLQFKAIFDAR